jgi:hypothetical protein
MTDKVVRFSVHKNTKEKRERHGIWEQLKEGVNSIPKDADGFLLISLKREEEQVFFRVFAGHRDSRDRRYMLELLTTEIKSH